MIRDFIYWEIINRLKGENKKVACAIIVYENKVLAQTAQINPAIKYDSTQWVFPGGKVEPGEKVLSAVHREIKEETNLNIDVIKRLGRIRNNKYELFFYLCEPTDASLLKVVEPNKQKELKWVSIDDTSIAWTPKNLLAIQKYKKQIEKLTCR